MISHVFHEWERRLAAVATDRTVRPFEWGLDWLERADDRDISEIERLERWADAAVATSDDFFALGPCTDFELSGNSLTFPSAIVTPHPENNVVRTRYFPEGSPEGRRRAVVAAGRDRR